jgi:predicted PurR-regulated permease PerM
MSEVGSLHRAPGDREETVQGAVEAAIRIGVIGVLLYSVFQIVAPFVSAILWGAILAVAGRAPYQWLVKGLGGRRVAAAVLFTALALVLLIIPALVLTGALVEWARGVADQIGEGRLAVPPAPEAVRSWPVVGERLYEFWSLANSNLAAALERAREPLQSIGVWLLSSAASAGVGVLQFALSIVVAGALLANAEGAKAAVDRFAIRLAPERGAHMRELAEQTVRGVATGVVGVAFIQSVLAAIGFFAVGVPGAPFLALVCLLLGMMQLPLAIPILPIVVYVWMNEPTLSAALFTAYILPVGALDNVLKPILMGRGVDAPMLVVFIGAIGGFASSGIVGLFLGAVVMVVAYELVRAWLQPPPASPPDLGRNPLP